MKAYLLLHAAPYLLLMTAACWHAIGLGTQGLRGRIVHWMTGIGMALGLLTPPWGWAEIGGAVFTVLFLRWLVTPEGREFARVVSVALVAAADMALRLLGRTLRWVLSPVAHEGAPAERAPEVPRHRDTLGSRMATTPPASLFEPEPWKRGTAYDTSSVPAVARVETYADIIGSVVAGSLGYNDGARYVHEYYSVSRSKFARDVRAIREEAA